MKICTCNENIGECFFAGIVEQSDLIILGVGANSVKFVYSEKATKFCMISTLILSTVHTEKSKVEILENFVGFSEYLNFKARNHNFTNFKWQVAKIFSRSAYF